MLRRTDALGAGAGFDALDDRDAGFCGCNRAVPSVCRRLAATAAARRRLWHLNSATRNQRTLLPPNSVSSTLDERETVRYRLPRERFDAAERPPTLCTSITKGGGGGRMNNPTWCCWADARALAASTPACIPGNPTELPSGGGAESQGFPERGSLTPSHRAAAAVEG